MMLEALVHLYETLRKQGKVEGEGWCNAKVTHALLLDQDGQLTGILSLQQTVQRGKKEMLVPAVLSVPQQQKRSVNIAPNFLCDTTSYFLGADDKGKPKRTLECFESAKALHHAVLDGCPSPAAKAILHFFDQWQPEKAKTHPQLLPEWDALMAAGNLVFWVDGESALEVPEIRAAWDAYETRSSGKDLPHGQCLVTGKADQPIAILHPVIKGVQGAQSSGASLVSFNAPAFESYGRDKSQGLNAPVSEYAAFAYGTALNYLLADREHREQIGDMAVVFWAETAEPRCQDLLLGGMNGTSGAIGEKELKAALEAIAGGTAIDLSGVTIDPETPFYILGLAPNAARLSVRFFWKNQLGVMIQNLMAHHKRMEIIQPRQDTPRMIPMWALLKRTANPNSKDNAASPLLAGDLLRSVITGSRYPEALFQNIMLRIFADQDEKSDNGVLMSPKIGYERAAFIKAYLLRNSTKKWEGQIQMTVNDNCKEISYVLGRLFSVLENIQQNANPGINATIKDRYFNAACATPASVFPILMKLANAHLGKLPANSQTYFNKKLGHLLSLITMPDAGTALPNRLPLEEQGAFVLGYYQETQDRYTKKEDK